MYNKKKEINFLFFVAWMMTILYYVYHIITVNMMVLAYLADKKIVQKVNKPG